MSGMQIGGVPLDTATIIRLIAIIVAALVVRQLVLRFGSRAIDNRRDKDRKPKSGR
ncbi:MAG TPA: hypothetical protein VKT27_04145 [Candidatus Binataceae bacterium]|nr:hypothetical protein [Candidatus Binataceae bacterium]